MNTAQAGHWLVPEIRLRVELAHSAVRVEAELSVVNDEVEPAPLVLDGRALTTHEVWVDGEPCANATVDERTLTVPLSAGHHVVRVAVTAQVGAPGDKGFVSFAGLVSTNLEPQGFRRIVWSPDRPSSRSMFDITLVGDPELFPVMLANGDRVADGALPDGRHWVQFRDPVPKPTYLVSMVGGVLEQRSAQHATRSGAVVKTTVVAPPDMIEGSGFALWAIDEMMSFDEQQGAVEHDLAEAVFVAVPGYPDATEYHGLMFFDPSLLIADHRGCTDDDLLLVAANVAHEYGHHARGNRVTVSSWGQLALKEGLTVLTAQNGFRRHMFGESARVLEVFDLRRLQFPEEATIGAPVVRGEVSDPTSLYTRTTYLKGAEVFAMLRTVVGEQRWHDAMVQFARVYDLGAAGVDDFVAVLREGSPEQASALDGVARWFTLTGRPAVDVLHEADRITLRRTDALFDDPSVAIPVVVGFLDADGQPVARSIDGGPSLSETVLVLQGREQSFAVSDAVAVVSPLRRYSAPVDMATNHTVEQLDVLLRHDTDPFVQWWASEELMIRVVDAHRTGGDAAAVLAVLAESLRSVAATVSDPLLLSQLLSVPDEFMLGDREMQIDIDGVAGGLAALRRELGVALLPTLADVWARALEAGAGSGETPAALGHRMLVEPVMGLLVASEQPEALALATVAFRHPNPTIAIRAFGQLAHSPSVPLDDLASEGYSRWSSAPKLVDRWLRAQTGSRRFDTIDRVEQLVASPLYDRDDRGRVMGVWFPFATRNRSVFHHASGRGYRLFVDELGLLMASNPGLAVRLVGDLLQFKRFDSNRSALLRAELERMVAMPGMPDFAVGILQHLLA